MMDNHNKINAIKVLKSLMKSLRDASNYFDEAHEYDRMNELDKTYNVLKMLVPVVRDIIEEQRDVKNLEKMHGNRSDVGFYALPVNHADDLIGMIEYTEKMVPFGEKAELNDYVTELSTIKYEVPKFDVGYVVVDVTDNHVLENKIFETFNEAKALKESHLNQAPSLIRNVFRVVKVSDQTLQYGAFPKDNKQMYFIYDIEPEMEVKHESD